jgi:hypothetical protein
MEVTIPLSPSMGGVGWGEYNGEQKVEMLCTAPEHSVSAAG